LHENKIGTFPAVADRINAMPPSSQPETEPDDGLEAAIDPALSACGGDLRATVRALIVANDYLESEVSELMKAVSHAYARGRFQSYSADRVEAGAARSCGLARDRCLPRFLLYDGFVSRSPHVTLRVRT